MFISRWIIAVVLVAFGVTSLGTYLWLSGGAIRTQAIDIVEVIAVPDQPGWFDLSVDACDTDARIDSEEIDGNVVRLRVIASLPTFQGQDCLSAIRFMPNEDIVEINDTVSGQSFNIG